MLVTPVTLSGESVRLEPMSLEHLESLCAIGLDPTLWEWGLKRLETPEQMREYVEEAIRHRDAGSALPFVTIATANGEVVGSSRYGNIDRGNRRVEIGWTWIAPQWQRTAINTEAKYLMLAHAFERLGVVRVELKTDALNSRSRAAIARIGAREEGILRNHMITADGRLRDSVYFSIIASEWPEVKRRLREKMMQERGVGSY